MRPRIQRWHKFRRARRAQLQATDIGLPTGDRRRADGLRREAVALLADISVDYYLRIEQGRKTGPFRPRDIRIAREQLDATSRSSTPRVIHSCRPRPRTHSVVPSAFLE
jgi:hypothetical protein